uniref:Transporter n=1 Tax=Nannocystis exedens TaxID=54 RepID=A0A3Q8I966_9BACT|nr:transporter [Nannocystis exedens]
MTPAERKVVIASSLGTLFEWYDFFLYGALAAVTSKHFFSAVNDTAALIFALLAFSAGFIVRPFGALVFGRLGDRSGRKRTFLITIVTMGLATVLVGCLPSYEQIGLAAPVLLIFLRLLQGLALGGEYGGAAIYVAEHAPADRRGEHTGWIQTMAAGGLLLSLGMIVATRASVGEDAFAEWGWRVPFLLSALLLAVSIWVRLSLDESPVFRRMQAEGRLSKAPLREAYGQWRYLKLGLAALFGIIAGQATLWYTGQFYTLYFLTQTLKVDGLTANLLVGVAVAVSAPFYLLFGRLSDRIGRKPLIVGGCLLAALLYLPLFKAITHHANPALEAARNSAPVEVIADPARCAFQFNPIGEADFISSCDIAKRVLARNAASYTNVPAAPGSVAVVRIGGARLPAFEGDGMDEAARAAAIARFDAQIVAGLRDAGYPSEADPNRQNRPVLVLLLVVLSVLSAMTYAPVAATLVELFPARIRYTAMSIPYHAGNGWIGGLLPPMAFALVAATGDPYAGLWYPLFFAVLTVVVGALLLPETRGADIDADRDAAPATARRSRGRG